MSDVVCDPVVYAVRVFHKLGQLGLAEAAHDVAGVGGAEGEGPVLPGRQEGDVGQFRMHQS